MEPKKLIKTLEKLRQQGNVVFKITFKRRRDKWVDGELVARAGDVREMVCQFGVKPKEANSKPDKARKELDAINNVITVYELAGEDSGYKCIPIDGIIDISPAPDLQDLAVLEAL